MKQRTIVLAAGCFWGVQYYFDQVPGVTETTVGYTGGTAVKPTYDDVCTGTTGHAEALRIVYNPDKVSLEVLLKHFFRMHDPSQLNRQGPDVGTQYRTAIFYGNTQEQAVAIDIRNQAQKKLGKPIVTDIVPAGPFYEAEPYHQKFTQRTGIGMCHIPYEPIK